MKINSIAAFIFTLLIVAACNKKQEKFLSSEDGYQYKYINKGDGKNPEEGKYFMFNLSYGPGDSVMFSTAEMKRPTGAFCSYEQWNTAGKFYGFLKEMKVGDSAILKIDAADFFNKTLNSSLPNGMSNQDTMIVHIGAYDIMDPFQFQMARTPGMKEQHEKDVKILEDYFDENNIENVQSLENGLKYVIHEEGNGPKPEIGDEVSVHYTGKLLDGTKFDSSRDRGKGPFSFNIGQGRVIMGWDQGFLNLKEGSKATLYIPSTMAYGSRGAGKTIPPNSILIFDVELLKVNKGEDDNG